MQTKQTKQTKQIVHRDIVVVGAGVAGLSFALYAAQRFPQKTIAVLSKGDFRDSNSYYAQGGVAAVMDQNSDSFSAHIEDTLLAGDGLSDPEIVRLVVEEAPQRMQDLMDWGVNFDRAADILELAREGGHSAKRVLHIRDHSGRSIVEALLSACESTANIQLLKNQVVQSLVLDGNGNCIGLEVDHAKARMEYRASNTILATGGAAYLYQRTSNPEAATGDGLALGIKAGAKMRDLAFVQFHPTVFPRKEGRDFLISEALRGFGALLRNQAGEDFMLNYHPLGSLATRDVVSRAIYKEMAREHSKQVFLDLRHLNQRKLQEKFPTIVKTILEEKPNFNFKEDLIPVSPAAHYFCGGIATDAWGRTSIPALFAIGEVAGTGLHGANRLASNSLLEAIVFAQRALEKLGFSPTSNLNNNSSQKGKCYPDAANSIKELRALMFEKVGIYRSREGLKQAAQIINRIAAEATDLGQPSNLDLTLHNMLCVAQAVVEDSLAQNENRGAFFLSDLAESPLC